MQSYIGIAETELADGRRCWHRVKTFGLFVEFCGQPAMPAHAKCAEHPDALNDLSLAALHCLETALWTALQRRPVHADRLGPLYLRAALEILARTEPGRRGYHNPARLDWPGGARGRHRYKVPARTQIG